jgi:hypothetical protein
MTASDKTKDGGSLPAAPSVPIQIEADTRCVNAHDLCWQGGPCPYCEIICYRDAQGRFAPSLPTGDA